MSKEQPLWSPSGAPSPPPATSAVKPAVVAAKPKTATPWKTLVVASAICIGSVILVTGAYHWLFAVSSVASSGYEAGRDFAPHLANSLADGFDEMADKVDAGATIEVADEALKATFLKSREKAFNDKASAGFAAIAPSGDDLANRKAYSAYAREFAKGLRGAK